MGIMMRNVAIGLAALAVATAGSTLTAPALPGGDAPGIARSAGHGDNSNIEKVAVRRWGRRGAFASRRFGPIYGFHHPVLGRKVLVHRYHVW